MSKQYAAIARPPFPELAVARRLKKPTLITQMSGNLADNENKGLPVCEWLSDPIFEPGNDLFDACEKFSLSELPIRLSAYRTL
jgi:hypothetical protein